MVKNMPAMREIRVRSLGWEDPLEKGTAIHSGILAWWIPWTEKPGGLQSMGSQRAGHDWASEYYNVVIYAHLTDWDTKVKVKVPQSCPTLCDPMCCIVHGIQARTPELVDFPFSRGSSQPRDQTQVSHTADGFFTIWATREAQEYWSGSLSLLQRIFPT